MQKGDKKQSEEIIPDESLAGPSSDEAIDYHTSLPPESTSSGSHHMIITNYHDAVKVLSEVELPNSPTRLAPATATGSLTEESNVVIKLHDQGQSSGTKKKAAGGEIASDKRRRNLISERIRALQALVPNCNKRDTASILSDAIDYIKYLQMQLQTMSTQGLYMFPTMQPRWQVPNVGPPFAVRPLIGMQQGIPQYGFYAPADIPVPFPLLMPPMKVSSGSSASPLLYPQQPQQQYSAETSSQAGSPVTAGQPSYHVPVTTQGTW